MDKIRTHKDLDVYKQSIEFVAEVYQFTGDFPDEEKFGLTSQLRRAAISIPTNISEGSSRKSTREFIQFTYFSLGSASEVETLIEICTKLDIGSSIKADDINHKLEAIKRMLLSLVKSLKNKKITN